MSDGVKSQRVVLMVRKLGSPDNIVKEVVYKFDMSAYVRLIQLVFDSDEDLYFVVEPYKVLQTYF